jgi:hypothetical protein
MSRNFPDAFQLSVVDMHLIVTAVCSNADCFDASPEEEVR